VNELLVPTARKQQFLSPPCSVAAQRTAESHDCMGKLLVQIDADEDERRPALWRKASERRRALLRRVTVHTLTRTRHTSVVHTRTFTRWNVGAVRGSNRRFRCGLEMDGGPPDNWATVEWATGPEVAVACRASGAAQSRVSSTVAAAASSGKKCRFCVR
jgi:hypothetical protein